MGCLLKYNSWEYYHAAIKLSKYRPLNLLRVSCRFMVNNVCIAGFTDLALILLTQSRLNYTFDWNILLLNIFHISLIQIKFAHTTTTMLSWYICNIVMIRSVFFIAVIISLNSEFNWNFIRETDTWTPYWFLIWFVDFCSRSRYHGQGQVITYHRYCEM